MKFNPKPYEKLLKRFIALQATSIDRLINNIIYEVTRQVGRANPPEGEDFTFKSYPALSKVTDGLLHTLSRQLTATVLAGSEWSWNLANTKNDDMLSRIVKSIGAGRIPEGAMERWSQKNLPALEAFQHRKIGGMNLSDKVWAYTKGIKGDLELAIDLSLGEGKSADSLSRAVRGFLNEPERLYRRVRDEKGVLHLSKAASNYHPGQGVYRSSYKNAKRLAATETNMAYRTSDHDRVQQMDFILGIEVHLSNNHTCLNSKGVPEPFYDICDELQGRYPKDFKFTGWHPLCRCYTTTILPDKDEFMDYLAAMDENGNSTYQFKNEVTDLPPQMTDWLEENQDRLLNAKSLPYWIQENPSIAISEDMGDKIEHEGLKGQLTSEERASTEWGARMMVKEARRVGDDLQSAAERISNEYGEGMTTPINYKKYDSIVRKCYTEGETPFDLKDTVRTTIIAGKDMIPGILEALQNEDNFARLKMQTPDKFLGYSGNIVNMKMSNGIYGEIQVNTPAMIYAKEKVEDAKAILGEKLWNEIQKKTGLEGGLGHAYYEKLRVLPEDSAEYKKWEKLSREYYSHFRW